MHLNLTINMWAYIRVNNSYMKETCKRPLLSVKTT